MSQTNEPHEGTAAPAPTAPVAGGMPYSSAPPPPPGGPVAHAAGAVPTPAPPPGAPLGKVRSTGTCVLLTVVTLGFYTLYWYYATHDEMKRHSGNGLGGGLALVLGIFLSIVMPFVSSNEVGDLYERRGWARPVSAATGLWALLLGWFFFVGLIVWFVKTNGALNAYWRSLGAR
jgi:hypothetical protein